MQTEERKQATTEKLTAFFTEVSAKEGTPNLNRVIRDTPLLVGDVVTFKVPENGCAADLLKLNETGIKYFYLTSVDGRAVSTSSLIGNRKNGVDVDGNTTQERITSLLAKIDETGELSLKVAKIRVLPSTRPDYNDQRIYTWSEA